MNKFTILFLTLFLALPMAMKADSAKEKKDDTRYLVGAVPEVDGKVQRVPDSRNESGTNLRHNDKVDERTSERK